MGTAYYPYKISFKKGFSSSILQQKTIFKVDQHVPTLLFLLCLITSRFTFLINGHPEQPLHHQTKMPHYHF